jgi:hypothetical protein
MCNIPKIHNGNQILMPPNFPVKKPTKHRSTVVSPSSFSTLRNLQCLLDNIQQTIGFTSSKPVIL